MDYDRPDLQHKFTHRYMWAQYLCWNYEDELPKGRITGTFSREYKTPEVEGEVLLHCLDISQKKTTLLCPKVIHRKQ